MPSDKEKDIKQTQSKLPLEKIDPIALETLAKIQAYGAKKYADTEGMSWKHGEINTYIGALLRHLLAYQKGEDIDPESKFTHLQHAFFNAYILIWLEDKENKEFDDFIDYLNDMLDEL